VGGGTRSNDMPMVNAARASNAGLADAFAAVIAADGSRLEYSTYIGGSGDDAALAIAAGPQGEIVVAGQTWSFDFPVPGGVQPPAGQLGDVFVSRLAAPALPVISSVINGAGFQAGIEPGSWVTIRGTNLANTSPGRTWRTDEVVNGNLPTSLDGVSVTINGKAAFVSYISPTQINVQAPSDSTAGDAAVVVTNHGVAGAPAAAQLQPFAPALFQSGAASAAASRLPDYAVIGDPTVLKAAVAAGTGDLVVLWGTGFGPTNPAVPAGTVVTGAPLATTAPTVTVGGVETQIVSTVLTAGCAGLYQITIRIPEGLPSGAAAVQATAGGIRTANGLTIFLATAR
jgi:uncharacterized protein (TIGR03437 family)